MSVVLPGGKGIAFKLIIIICIVRNTLQSNCPLIRSFTDNSGILIVNKNLLSYSELPAQCQWLIASSPQQNIIIEFDYIYIPVSPQEYLHRGCYRGSVSLWTVGLKHEKIELCGDRRKIRVGGIGRILMIELRMMDPELDVYLFMKYQLTQVSVMPTTPPTRLLPTSTAYSFEKHVHTQSLPYSECGMTWNGLHRLYDEISSRIVGGRQVLAHSYPWQVLLNNRGHFCGASVLNTKWIITAAHCVNGTTPSTIVAEFGIHDRYRIEFSRTARTIKQIVYYPSYGGKSTRWVHDIALLQLSEPLVFNAYIRPVCLPSGHETVKNGERTLVTGWGATRGTGSYRFLREVEVPIQSNDQCGLKGISLETSLCAGLCKDSTCDTCRGDSGGPMVLERDNRWSLVGLVSWGFSCGGLGVYTKVSYYSEWIKKIIQN